MTNHSYCERCGRPTVQVFCRDCQTEMISTTPLADERVNLQLTDKARRLIEAERSEDAPVNLVLTPTAREFLLRSGAK